MLFKSFHNEMRNNGCNKTADHSLISCRNSVRNKLRILNLVKIS
uniref:Uncharacterized protein n=1 Tax=Brugia timori TaxID=42155 RepID=A0A0R3R9C9_9BILA